MARTLNEIVSASLAAHDLHQKVASVRSTEPLDPGEEFLAAELGQLEVKIAAEDEDTEKEEKKDKEKKKEASVLDDAALALKFATALDSAAAVIEKIAQAEAPAVTESGHAGEATQSPKPSAHMKPHMAPHGTASLPVDDNIPTQEAGATNHPGKMAAVEKIAADRSATQRLLSAKIAEYDVCMSMGNLAAAKVAAKTALELKEKLAEGTGGLDTSEGTSSHIPDNAGLIAMTKAQARDTNTREATAFYGVAPKQDNAVQAHVGRTDGLKVSANLAPLKSLLSKGDKALQAVGGKVLDASSRGAKTVAGAAENRLFNGPTPGKTMGKVLEHGAVKGYNASKALGAASGTETGRRVAGGAVLGAGALGVGKLLGSKKED